MAGSNNMLETVGDFTHYIYTKVGQHAKIKIDLIMAARYIIYRRA